MSLSLTYTRTRLQWTAKCGTTEIQKSRSHYKGVSSHCCIVCALKILESKKFLLPSLSLFLSFVPTAHIYVHAQFHEYVGRDPSGETFNSFTLNANHMPPNPLVNTGAIVASGLLKRELNAAGELERERESMGTLF